MLDSPIRALVACLADFGVFCYAALLIIAAAVTHKDTLLKGFLLLVLSWTAGLILPIVLYTEDVPGTRRVVTAQVTGKDLHPTSDITGNWTDGVVGRDTEAVDEPTRHSVLLQWPEGQGWLPVPGRAFRKLEVGQTVSLQVQQQRDVTLLMKLRPKQAIGPIVPAEAVPSKN